MSMRRLTAENSGFALGIVVLVLLIGIGRFGVLRGAHIDHCDRKITILCVSCHVELIDWLCAVLSNVAVEHGFGVIIHVQ